MKKTLIGMLFVLLLTAFAAAQSDSAAQEQTENQQAQRQGHYKGQNGERMNPQVRLDRMSQKLNLTDDQKAKILPILQDESSKAQSLRDDTSLSQSDKRAKFQALRQGTMNQIRPILTQEQQQKLDTMHNEKGRHHHGDSGAQPQ